MVTGGAAIVATAPALATGDVTAAEAAAGANLVVVCTQCLSVCARREEKKKPVDDAQAKRAAKLAAWKASMAANKVEKTDAAPAPSETAGGSTAEAAPATQDAPGAPAEPTQPAAADMGDAHRMLDEAAATRLEIERALKTVEADKEKVIIEKRCHCPTAI